MCQIRIPEELYHYFETAGYRQHYKVNKDIYMQGDDAGRIYFIRKERVRAYYVISQGHELTYEIIEKGRISGESSFLPQCAKPVCVAAVTQAELTACDLNQLYVYMGQSPRPMQTMLQLLSGTCNHLIAQLRRITLYDRYQHIANLLLSEIAASDYSHGITSPSISYIQEDLAPILNFSRVTVSRVLSEWKGKGTVTASYGKIMILKHTSLEALFLTASSKYLTR